MSDPDAADPVEASDEPEAARDSRDTGGDAEAAASVEEREAVARGDDDLFEGDG
jgi:hypothetical protein